jgi:hypothetical protein
MFIKITVNWTNKTLLDIDKKTQFFLPAAPKTNETSTQVHGLDTAGKLKSFIQKNNIFQ